MFLDVSSVHPNPDYSMIIVFENEEEKQSLGFHDAGTDQGGLEEILHFPGQGEGHGE
jgi:hypothetical protein